MSATTAEFDAFGPWIYEIHAPGDVPRLFRTYPLDIAAAKMTIKVPRLIERRDANPAMDLYDMVVSLGPSAVTVLRRRGREYDSEEVAYGSIQAIVEAADLLDGRLVLHADEGRLSIRYNTSSAEIISHFVAELRRLYVTGGGAGTGRGTSRLAVPDLDRDLQNLYRRLTREGAVGRIFATQKRRTLTAEAGGAVQQLLARAWPTTLQAAIFTIGETELQVLHRASGITTGYKPVHSLVRTLIPLERIRKIEVHPHEGFPGVSVVTVRAGHVPLDFIVDDAVAHNVATELRALNR